MANRNLMLLSGKTPVARIENGNIRSILPDRLPLYLKRTGDFEGWLASRAVDSHRVNSRLLKKVLRLAEKDDVSTVLSVNAVTITDNFWVKDLLDTATTYPDVRFTVNRFDKLALKGDVNSFNQAPSRTPELTNTGSFEKCWRLDDGEWWMIKSGKPEELFSELLIYRIGNLLGFPMAEYAPDGQYIKSRDFTHNAKVNFEPAASIIGDESDYIKIYDALKPFGEAVTDRYLEMCYLDALIINMDRHEHNFGVLRNGDTGDIISLAPIFDHNIALVSRGYPRSTSFENDILINDFSELVRYAKRPQAIRKLIRSELMMLMKNIPWELPQTPDVADPIRFTVDYTLKRQERLIELNRDIISFQNPPVPQRGER